MRIPYVCLLSSLACLLTIHALASTEPDGNLDDTSLQTQWMFANEIEGRHLLRTSSSSRKSSSPPSSSSTSGKSYSSGSKTSPLAKTKKNKKKSDDDDDDDAGGVFILVGPRRLTNPRRRTSLVYPYDGLWSGNVSAVVVKNATTGQGQCLNVTEGNCSTNGTLLMKIGEEIDLAEFTMTFFDRTNIEACLGGNVSRNENRTGSIQTLDSSKFETKFKQVENFTQDFWLDTFGNDTKACIKTNGLEYRDGKVVMDVRIDRSSDFDKDDDDVCSFLNETQCRIVDENDYQFALTSTLICEKGECLNAFEEASAAASSISTFTLSIAGAGLLLLALL